MPMIAAPAMAVARPTGKTAEEEEEEEEEAEAEEEEEEKAGGR